MANHKNSAVENILAFGVVIGVLWAGFSFVDWMNDQPRPKSATVKESRTPPKQQIAYDNSLNLEQNLELMANADREVFTEHEIRTAFKDLLNSIPERNIDYRIQVLEAKIAFDEKEDYHRDRRDKARLKLLTGWRDVLSKAESQNLSDAWCHPILGSIYALDNASGNMRAFHLDGSENTWRIRKQSDGRLSYNDGHFRIHKDGTLGAFDSQGQGFRLKPADKTPCVRR